MDDTHIDLHDSEFYLCCDFADLNKLSSLESLILDHNTKLQLLPATLLKMKDLKMIGLSGWYVFQSETNLP